MKKLFSYMKNLVSSTDGSETAEAQECEPCGSGDDSTMTIVPPPEEEAVVAQDNNNSEQMDPGEFPLLRSADDPKRPESEDSDSCELSRPCGGRTVEPTAVPLEATNSAGDAATNGKDTVAASAATAATAAAAEDLRTNSSGTDSSSWELKAKDVKVALKENGGNNAVIKEAEHSSAGKHAAKPDVIHPLQNSWGIWCFLQNRSLDWHENVKHISNFTSVEDFWSLVDHIRAVDSLPIGCDYFVFKANIQPMWEDKANVNGGRWLLKIPQSHPNFVDMWTETLLLLVGEAFEAESESICGAVAQVRRGFNKISIWTRDAGDRSACMRIGYRWKSCIKVPAPIHYEAHMEVNRKGGRRSKSVYSIN